MPKKRIEVNIATQILTAYDGKKKVFEFEAVTGSDDHPTSKGTFHIFQKNKKYHSRAYDAEMDYAMFFTHDGEAIHQYQGPGIFSVIRTFKQGLSGWFGSHGCVRLQEDDVKQLFDWAPTGTEVKIL